MLGLNLYHVNKGPPDIYTGGNRYGITLSEEFFAFIKVLVILNPVNCKVYAAN